MQDDGKGIYLCPERWASRSKHRGTKHVCCKPKGHDGRHKCACGMPAK